MVNRSRMDFIEIKHVIIKMIFFVENHAMGKLMVVLDVKWIYV